MQGTYETFVEMGRQHYNGSLKGKWILTAGLGGMGGAQPLAASLAGAMLAQYRMPADPYRFPPEDALRRRAGEAISTMRSRESKSIRRRAKPVSIALLGNAAEVLPEMVKRGVKPDRVTDQTSAHDPVNGYLPQGWTIEHWLERTQVRSGWHARRRRSNRCASRCEAMLAFHAQGIPTLDYGNNIRQMALDEGCENAFDFPGFVPAYVRPLFCEGKGPFRWVALSGDPGRHLQDRCEGQGTDPRRSASAQLARHGARTHQRSRACRRASAGWAWAMRHRLGLAFNEMVRNGEAEGADRDRPRSPRYRLGRQAEPRNRIDEGRQRRRQRLAAAQRLAQHGGRRDVGVAAPRRRRRHGLLAALAAW